MSLVPLAEVNSQALPPDMGLSLPLPPCPVVSWAQPQGCLIYPAQSAWTTANKPFSQQLRKVQTKTSCFFFFSETPTIARNQKDCKIRGGVFACCSGRTWLPCFSLSQQMASAGPLLPLRNPKARNRVCDKGFHSRTAEQFASFLENGIILFRRSFQYVFSISVHGPLHAFFLHQEMQTSLCTEKSV